MTQDTLRVYLEQNDCYVYRTKHKEDGEYLYLRRNDGLTIATLFPPKAGRYKPESVCHICDLLDVEVPDYATEAKARLAALKQHLKNPK
jgi:hypothetical protein